MPNKQSRGVKRVVYYYSDHKNVTCVPIVVEMINVIDTPVDMERIIEEEFKGYEHIIISKENEGVIMINTLEKMKRALNLSAFGAGDKLAVSFSNELLFLHHSNTSKNFIINHEN